MWDVARSRRPSRKSLTGRYYTPPTPPPETRTPPPPPHPPPKGSAEKHEELPKVARTSVEKSATDHTRCSEVTMIWKETRKWRGLRSPSEPKKRTMGTDKPQRDIRWLGEPQGWREGWYGIIWQGGTIILDSWHGKRAKVLNESKVEDVKTSIWPGTIILDQAQTV